MNHNALVFPDGRTYVWGRNDHGQLGLGHRNNVLRPTLLDDFSFKKVICGTNYSIGLTFDNQVYAWGR